MDWKTFVTQKCLPVGAGIVIGACSTILKFEACRVEIKDPLENSVVHCSRGDKNYKKPLPYLKDYWCTNDEDFKKILDRLDDCERRCP